MNNLALITKYLVLWCENLLDATKKLEKKTEKNKFKILFFMKIIISWGKNRTKSGNSTI